MRVRHASSFFVGHFIAGFLAGQESRMPERVVRPPLAGGPEAHS